MTPTVSVCLPAYNSADYIGRTVASILGQSRGDLELIVVDDCSTDGTDDVVASFADPRLRLVRNERNLGPVDNWNKALAQGSGRYIKVVCGDDVLYERCLERQVSALDAHPSAALVASPRDVIDANDRMLLRARGLAGLTGLRGGLDVIRAVVRAGTNVLGEPVCVLMRSEAVAATGGFSGHVPYMIDVEYWCRLLGVGDLVGLDEALCAFRVSDSAWSTKIGSDQASQASHLLLELRDRHPDVVSGADLRRGLVRAHLLSRARLSLYATLRLRAAMTARLSRGAAIRS